MTASRVLRLASLAVVGFVVCGGLGTLAGVLAAIPFHGTTRQVVWLVVAPTVAIAAGYFTDKLAHRKDVRP